MAVRHRLAAIILAIGLLAGLASWRSAGPWVALGVGMAAMILAAAVYRIDRRQAAEESVSTRRPAAAPPSRSGRGS